MFKEKEKDELLKYSNAWLIDRFFKYGSIDAAIWEGRSLIPFSYMSYYRHLCSAGIVRSPGRQTSLTEALHFFRIKQMEKGMPLEEIYRSLPPSFKTSITTLHRIYGNLENAIPGRVATALVISSDSDSNNILTGREVSNNKLYGKIAGIASIPMTFSHLKDNSVEGILRVLQQEVLTNDAIQGKFSDSGYVQNLLSTVSGPFLKYRVLDVELSCYRMVLPENATFSSYKLTDHKYVNAETVLSDMDGNFRIGVKDIVSEALFPKVESSEITYITSPLNLALARSI